VTDEQQDESIAERVGRQLFGERGAYRLRMLHALDPGFARLFEEFCYGGLYARGVLDDRVRELCAVAALIPQNRPYVLETHLKAALRSGATREEVLEVIFQSAVYAGMPACLTTLDQFKRLEEAGDFAGFGPSYTNA
jgi:alkylhydroperoxidase/carboxymuconolactone decarboxylase family protein YurZ